MNFFPRLQVFEAAIDSAQPPQLSEPSSSSSPVDVSEALATLTPTKRAEIVRDILLAEGFEAKKQTKEKKARRAELVHRSLSFHLISEPFKLKRSTPYRRTSTRQTFFRLVDPLQIWLPFLLLPLDSS
jgi:hypothetical protein